MIGEKFSSHAPFIIEKKLLQTAEKFA